MPRTRLKKLEEKLPRPGRKTGRPNGGFNDKLKKMMNKPPKNQEPDDEEDELYDNEVINLNADEIEELRAQLEELKEPKKKGGRKKQPSPEQSEESEEEEPKPKKKPPKKQEENKRSFQDSYGDQFEQVDLKALMKELLAQEKEQEKKAIEDEKKKAKKAKDEANKQVQAQVNRIRSSLNF